jgi:cysteine desulfurase
VATALDVTRRHRTTAAAQTAPLAADLQELLEKLGGRPTGGTRKLPNYATAAFAGVRGEDLLLALDLEGVAASSGSACASGSLDPSHVLLAMGFSLDEALGSLRLTLGYATTRAEVEFAKAALERVLAKVGAGA